MVNYFELYYLEAGIRYHVVEDTVYCLYPGDYILYPPYVMHRSYSGEDSYFKRIVLYFTKAVVPDSQIFSLLSKRTWLYRQDDGEAVVGLLHELMAEQDKGDMYSAKYCLRVSHAQRLLEGTDKSITEISSLVGFSNVTHFNRVFRSLTGKSPTQSRKMLRTELKN